MISESFTYDGARCDVTYEDADAFDALPDDPVTQHFGVCFYDGRIVVGWHGGKSRWTLLGGKIESGESYDHALVREVGEEANMKVLASAPVGYQRVIQEGRAPIVQLRSVCVVEPYGPFNADPAGDITKVKLITPAEWDAHIDWGPVGRHILACALARLPELLRR